MTVKDYFKISFKKPEITESISQVINKKNILKKQLDLCQSRLESIEICNSNSKSADALILGNYLLVDILNLALLFFDRSPITFWDKWKETLSTINDSKLKDFFQNSISVLESDKENEDEKAELLEISLANLLDSLEKYIFKANQNLWENPVEDFKKKLTIQAILGIMLLAGIVNFGFKKFNELGAIKDDVSKLYFMNEQNRIPVHSNLVTAKVTPSLTWQDVSFVLPNPSDVKDIKVEPVHQRAAKIQIRSVKYLDPNKNIIYERDFKINQNGIIENSPTNELCCLEDLKIGRLSPDKYLEVESTNVNPSFYIKVAPMTNVKEIILSLRYIKNRQKFTD